MLKKTFWASILIIICFQVCLQAQVDKKPISLGEQITLNSNILQEKRTVNIYLPEGYEEEPSNSYPVIYLLDGGLSEDFIHLTGIVQFGSFSWINMLPQSIVVGTCNVDRKRDFTYPSTFQLDQEELPTSGGSANFIAFLKDELQPYISKTYRVNNQKTIIGQSLGGLLATEILFTQPSLFNNYIIVSPSLWWDSENLLKSKPEIHPETANIFVSVGKEGEVMERTARELFQLLKNQPFPKTKLYFQFMEDKNHGDALHQSVYNAFEKFYTP